jgi:serine/threonine protein kinase
MPSTKSLSYLIISSLIIITSSIILYMLFNTNEFIIIPFVFIIAVWIYVLFFGTNRLALNYNSYPISSGGKWLSFALFLSGCYFSILYINSIYGKVASMAVLLFFLVGLCKLYMTKNANAKTCGYGILLPFAFTGCAHIGGLLFHAFVPNGLAVGLLFPLAFLIVGYLIYRLRARTVPIYTLSLIFIGLTIYGIYSEVNYYGLSPYLYLFESLVLISFISAHCISFGSLNLKSPFKSIKSCGNFLFNISILFFIFGTFNLLFPEVWPTFTGAYKWSSLPIYSIAQPFALLMLVLVLFSILAMISSRYSFPVSYGFLTVISAYGILSLVKKNINGFWTPTTETYTLIWAVVVILLFYEPTYRFIDNYTRMPYWLSLEHNLRINKNPNILGNGRYQIQNTIGSGGFATIFEGYDTLAKEGVVIKEPKACSDISDPVESIEYSINQLHKEIDLLKLLDFPGIVKYIDSFQEGGRYFLVEERIDGRTIHEMTKKQGFQFSLAETNKYVLEVLYALNYLHMHGVLHRDLSSRNIMITSQGKIKLIDFGISKRIVGMEVSGFHKNVSGVIGSEGFAAPEINLAMNDGSVNLSFSYDIYSVGALMYQMISGNSPNGVFEHNVETILSGKCDIKLISIVKKAMASDPHNRYQTAFEMIAAIKGYKGKFIVTDHAETYDITVCPYAIIQGDSSYRSSPGNVFQGQDTINLVLRTNKMIIGSINFNPSKNQHELIMEKNYSFNTLTSNLEKEKRNIFFLSPSALFWLDEGNGEYRDGVFGYFEL